MLPIHVFILMFVIQVCCYIALDKYHLSKWKYLVLLLGLVLDFIILPEYFMPQYKEGELRCGLPSMGVLLAFWVFGGGSIILTHIIYIIVQKNNKVKTGN